MKVVIIGTGNVASVLGKKIQGGGHEVLQVVGRSFEKTNLLASLLNCNAAYNTRYINMSADIYIIAVLDSAIQFVASHLKLGTRIVVHTAAAVSKNVLATCGENFGVIYPLQTLIKETAELPFIPVLIDGNNETTKRDLIHFSSDWADHVVPAGDEERLKMHIAGVFVNNFTNYLFSVAEEYCRKERLKFNLVYPLIEETVQRIKYHSPTSVQTGPAVRKDHVTIENHKKALENYPELSHIYNLLTTSIESFYSRNKAQQ